MHLLNCFKRFIHWIFEDTSENQICETKPTELEMEMEHKLDIISDELDHMKETVCDISERVCHNSEDLRTLIEAEKLINTILERQHIDLDDSDQ